MYDEMECLQGVVIPRCYGWFEMELGQLFDAGYSLDVFEGHRTSDMRDDNALIDYDLRITKKVHPLVQERRCQFDVLSVLVLERLGDKLPLDRLVPKETR